ncbi:FadR/GntR family transcriptional regulator [Lentzea jiangxiensis]|uniref:DNA-binding transcriptional regulator, FadR family n=1 Tax=Lentzea jiangxiensis TaxID=641025 RepID=A0A1H0KW46_9PSEU|nr:FadR/GntR family transcriptional regulator [Lentzea jiangxiensis]SDO60159.1 DNA-binding transcriptional regulator, FadR family [Lentzea jiangxiensis]
MTATGRQAGQGVPADPVWTRRPASLAAAVTAEMVQRIVRHSYPAGMTLPPEPVLCETFSVSRTVIREAVKVLQEKGLVTVRQGSGTTVNPPVQWNVLDEQVLLAAIAEDESLATLDDLVVTRRLLESDMAQVAARTADDETVDRLRALVDRMDELVDDVAGYEEHDRLFHDAIMLASGNRIARGVVRSLQSQVLNTAGYRGESSRELCQASNAGHRRVLDRIAAHDPAGAAEAMFTHITEAWLVRRGEAGDPGRLNR